MDEVASWYFEVWNEPNIDFWAGEPKQATYWQLYDHSARAIKAVSPRLRIGGPATAQAAWADAFLKHCADENVPVDFVSTHVYGNDRSQDVFGTNENIPRSQLVCRAVAKVHEQIRSSSRPNLPLIWSEFNASYMTEPAVTDSVYMGSWLAETIRQCDGLVDMMSYWTFSDVFEEQGVVQKPFYGGYGLIAEDHIPKPAYNAFLMLHKLGDQRINVASDSALVTRGDHGSLVLAAWNYSPPEEAGTTKTLTLHFKNTSPAKATIWRLDADHGDVHRRYDEMGQPRYPTASQVEALRLAAQLGSPEQHDITAGDLTLTLSAHSLVVIETH
jgi:xylan 1,4-beta-xylosidase